MHEPEPDVHHYSVRTGRVYLFLIHVHFCIVLRVAISIRWEHGCQQIQLSKPSRRGEKLLLCVHISITEKDSG